MNKSNKSITIELSALDIHITLTLIEYILREKKGLLSLEYIKQLDRTYKTITKQIT